MNKIKLLTVFVVIFVMSACGGGGGDPGKTNAPANLTSQSSGGNDTTNVTSTTDTSVITLALTDKDFVSLKDNTINRGSTFYAYATVKSGSGVAIPNVSVTFSVPAAIADLPQLSALTNASGVASVIISPAGLRGGSGSLTASATAKGQSLSASIDFQTSQSNVTLYSLTSDQTNISAYQTTGVSAKILVNGSKPSSGLATVNFSASCGSFSPVSGINNSEGIVTSTYQANASCEGDVRITASIGANTTNATVKVTAPAAVAISYMGATVPTMVTSRVGGGSASSVLKFRLLDNGGNGLGSRNLRATLASETMRAGVTFSDGTNQEKRLTTDETGYATVVIFAGAFPVPVNVRVAVVGQDNVSGNSVGVAVSSGKATQKTISLSSELASMESYGFDGVENKLTFTATDRLGNPVPAETTVNFITNNGLIISAVGSTRGSCKLNDKSQCTVTYSSIGGDSRPSNGRVVVLAYMDGEEVFYDTNGNNQWDSGESFEQLGRPFMDTDANGTYENNSTVFDQLVGYGTMGTQSCVTRDAKAPDSPLYTAYLSIPDTCDTSKWRDDVLVRKQITLVMATQDARMELVSAKTIDRFSIFLSDNNRSSETTYTNDLNSKTYTVGRNSMPTGSKISAAVVAKEGLKCKLLAESTDAVPFQTEGVLVNILLDGASDCQDAKVSVTVEAARTKTKTTVYFQ